MARVSSYLNFPRNCQQAFEFYRSVFGGEFEGPIHRYGEMPPEPGRPPLDPADKDLVLHMQLKIMDGFALMGSDMTESMGGKLIMGNSIYLNLEPETRAEADRLFKGLSEGGKVEMPMADMFWGAYFGSFRDRFGIQWMVNCEQKA